MYSPDNVLTKAIFIVKLISNGTLIQNVAATWNGRRTVFHHPLFSPAYEQLPHATERYQLRGQLLFPPGSPKAGSRICQQTSRAVP
jgi:hypothetical protein